MSACINFCFITESYLAIATSKSATLFFNRASLWILQVPELVILELPLWESFGPATLVFLLGKGMWGEWFDASFSRFGCITSMPQNKCVHDFSFYCCRWQFKETWGERNSHTFCNWSEVFPLLDSYFYHYTLFDCESCRFVVSQLLLSIVWVIVYLLWNSWMQP